MGGERVGSEWVEGVSEGVRGGGEERGETGADRLLSCCPPESRRFSALTIVQVRMQRPLCVPEVVLRLLLRREERGRLRDELLEAGPDPLDLVGRELGELGLRRRKGRMMNEAQANG